MIGLRVIAWNSVYYQQMISLRMDLLRRPLGLTFTPEQLGDEKNDILVGAFDGEDLIGCCVLTQKDRNTIQLRQMAVRDDLQKKGIGKKIIAFAEEKAIEKGYTLLIMHARHTATGFYKKAGYEIKGEEFREVGIAHRLMEKKLVPGNKE